MALTAIAASSSDGAALGELTQASQRKLTIGLNRGRVWSFQVRRDNELAAALRRSDLTLVKVYDDINGTVPPQLRLVGPVIGYNKTADERGGSIAVNVADPSWRLGRRIIESSKSVAGVYYSGVDRGQAVRTFINEINTATGGFGGGVSADTGIRSGTITPTTTSNAGPWYYKNALQAITDLGAPLGGFDWQLYPVEPVSDATGLKLCHFDCGPMIGQVRPNVVFEYGDGKLNVVSFTENGDAGVLINRGYSLPPGFPDNATQAVLMQVNNSSAAQRGIYEDTIPSDLIDDTMRTQLLSQNMTIRSQPRTVITFQPSRVMGDGYNNFIYGQDFLEGDIVRFRAVEEGVETINGLFRIYVVELGDDEQGNITPVLTLFNDDTVG